MKLYNFCIFSFIFLLLSCNIQESKPVKTEQVVEFRNDTTKIIVAAIKSIFEPVDLPGIEALKKPYHFNDSILLSSDTIIFNLLPQNIDSIKFKIVTSSQIRSMLKVDSGRIPTPNYLYIGSFEKTDTGYSINLSSLSGVQFRGGGLFMVNVVKQNDSFIVKHRMSGSLN